MDSSYLCPVYFVQHLDDNYRLSLTFLHLNVRSAKHKAMKLECIFDQISIKLNAIRFTETWYLEETSVFSLPS